jgi:hypothetical protein
VISQAISLVEETKDLTTGVLLTGFLVIHDTSRGGQDEVTELTSGQQVGSPLFELTELDVEARRDDTTLVKTAIELDDDLTGTVVIDLLEFTNVT